MTNLEDLLTPLSSEQPCGEDLSYDAGMQELDTLLRGKPETQFSPAEDPNWEQVRDHCLDLFQRSKDLRVAVALCLALLKTEGMVGFERGLAMLRRLLEQYWELLYPRLDPEDQNDPRERVNILSALLTSTFDDPMQFLGRLRAAPLSVSPMLGRFSLDDIAKAQTGGEGAPSAAQVEGAFRDTNPETLERIATAVTESISDTKAIDDFLTRTLGSGQAPDWTPLIGVLHEMRKTLARYAPQIAGAADASGSADEAAGIATGNGHGSAGAATAVPGAIRSRQDVSATIDRICDFYASAEPSSPVPLLLRRAQRLIDKSFIDIVNDLSPDALARVYDVTGTQPSS
jgi:type VI secretion system protein ImpA